MLTVILVFVVILIIAKICLGSDRNAQAISAVPGPPVRPIVGNLFQINFSKGNPYRQFTDWAKKYGPVYKLRIGPKQWVVVVNNYESFVDALMVNGKSFCGRASNYRDYIFSKGAGLIAVDGRSAKLKLSRRLAIQAMKGYGPGMLNIERWATELTQEFVSAFDASGGEPIDPREEIHSATMKIISLVIFGEKFQPGSEEYQTIQQVLKLVNKSVGTSVAGLLLDIFPWLRYCGNRVYNDMSSATEMSMTFWEKVFKRTAEADNEDMCLVRTMLKYNKTCKSDELFLNDDDMRVLAFQLQMAGIVTTSGTLYALLNILLHYPDEQEKIYQEIKRTIGERQVQLDDQNSMHYTRAAILETLRYTSITPLSIPHKAVEDATILGYTIPKDTLVIMNRWAAQKDGTFWSNPGAFKPERFLDENGELVGKEHPNRQHLFAFGAGPRSCVGEHIANARLFLWIVAILQRFHLQPVGDKPDVSCDPEEYKPGLVLSPPDFKLRFLPRRD